MAEAGLVLGNYGDNTIGLKTSIPGFDALVRSDDFDSNKRSFNSEWTNLCKVKLYGVGITTWTAFQEQQVIAGPPNPQGDRQYTAYSRSGWRADPTPVATGLTYIPIWEERTYNPSSAVVFDDNLYQEPQTPSGIRTFSGARSYFSGPGLSPNIVWFEPIQGSSQGSFGGQTTTVVNENESARLLNQIPPYPPFPGFPAQPGSISQKCIYVIYANKLGDVS